MRSLRILALPVAIIICLFLAACGGSGGGNKNPTQPLGITSTVLPQATVNVPYSFVMQASGGKGTYTWSITKGALPPKLSFDGQTAVISGTPAQAGKFTFTVQVKDGVGDTASQALTLDVGGAIQVTCNSCLTGTLNLPAGVPGTPYTASFSASGGIAPYTWCVVESSGSCDSGAGGALPAGLTINATTGVISGTPTMALPPTPFTVQAKDSESPSSIGTAQITLSIFGVSTPNLPAGKIYVPYGTQEIMLAGGTPPYSWCVMESNGTCDNGSGGALPPGITLSPNCTSTRQTTCAISGTPTSSGAYNFTVLVTDSETPPASSTAGLSIDIAGIGNSLLTGNYLIALSGYQSGNAYVLVSGFVADGNGNITSGYVDLNNGSGETIDNGIVVPQTITTGSAYNINSNGTGTITIVTSAATYKFDFVASASACTPGANTSSCGRIIQTAPASPQMYGAGVLKVQDPTYFVATQIFPGSFAFQAVGVNPSGNRFAAAGSFIFDPSTLVDLDCALWNLSSGCPMDQNSNGSTFYNSFKGSFSSTIDPVTGRGNFADISYPNDPNGICLGTLSSFACSYAFYVVNKEEMVMISADPQSKPANLTLWSAFRQTTSAGGWTLTALTGNSIAELTALDSSGGSPQADIMAGVLNSDAKGDATLNTDENDGGTLNQQQSSQGTYAIDTSGQKTGKITLSGFGTQFGTTPPILYMYGSNYGFFVGTDAKVTSGVLEPQVGTDYTASSVVGPYAGGSTAPTLPAVTDTATFLFADGVGTLAGQQYTVGSSGPGGPNNLALTYTVSSSGRTLVQNGTNLFGIGYVVQVVPLSLTKKFILIPVGNDPTLNVFAAGTQ